MSTLRTEPKARACNTTASDAENQVLRPGLGWSCERVGDPDLKSETSNRRDLSWNLTSALLPILGSFLVSVFLAPYLGDALWGRYSLVMTATTLWLIVAKFGVHAATSRLVSEHDADAGIWIRAGLLLRGSFAMGVALLSAATAIPLGHSFGLQESAGIFLWIVPVLVAASAQEFATELLVGLRQFRGLLAARASMLLLRLAAVSLVVIGSRPLGDFLGGHALAQAIPATVVLILLLRAHPRHHAPLRPALRRTWELSLPLAFGSASFLIFSHTDRLMLGWFWNESTVGQFAVARNVLDASLFPMTAVAWSLRPALVRAATGRGDFGRELRRGALLGGGFALLAPLLLGLLGPRLVVMVFGPGYTPAAELLRWMLPILALRAAGVLIFPALIALDEQSHYARLMAITAAVNVLANLFLIPRWGSEGAVVGTLIALLVLTVGGYLRVGRRRGLFLDVGRRGA